MSADEEPLLPGADASAALPNITGRRGYRKAGARRPPPVMTTIDDVMATARTGDLILFETISTFGLAISLFGGVRWSHVAMVVRVNLHDRASRLSRAVASTVDRLDDPGCYDEDAVSAPFLWESVRHNEGMIDMITGRVNKAGPQLVDLRSRLELHALNGDGNIALRRVSFPTADRAPYGNLSRARLARLEDFMLEVAEFGYSTSKAALVDSLLKLFCVRRLIRADPFDRREYFCSQLQADTYTVMGVLEPDRESRHYTLNDFVQRKQDLALAEGADLGPETRVIMLDEGFQESDDDDDDDDDFDFDYEEYDAADAARRTRAVKAQLIADAMRQLGMD